MPREDAAPLLSVGMPLLRGDGKDRAGWKFLQPCAAFDGCRCRIYSSRPNHCKNFECLLLKGLRRGELTRSVALGLIHRTRRKAERVDRLLRELTDADRGLALGERFRRCARRLEQGGLDSGTVEKFGQLTVSFQQLNFTLAKHFYPVPGN